MTHTVCQPCYDCKYTDCVAVCPVECFYQDEKMLYIDPADCIDCEACVPECPVEAIFAEANVPAQWTSFTPLNAERSTALKDAGQATSPRRTTRRKAPSARRRPDPLRPPRPAPITNGVGPARRSPRRARSP